MAINVLDFAQVFMGIKRKVRVNLDTSLVTVEESVRVCMMSCPEKVLALMPDD